MLANNTEKEFTRYIKNHKGIAYSVIKKYQFINEFEQDDYYQEIIIYAWNRFSLFDKYKSSFPTWFFKTAQWAILHYRRFLNKEEKRMIYFEDHRSWIDIADDKYDESEIESLYKAIADLTPEYKKVVALYLSGANLTRESVLAGSSGSYFEGKMSRIKAQIRKNYSRYFEDAPAIKPRIKYHTAKSGKDNHLSKPIIMQNLEGKFIKRFESLGEAERNGFNHRAISLVANGKHCTAYGYIWRYEGENRPEVLNRVIRKAGEGQVCKPVDQLGENGNLIRTWPSISSTQEGKFTPSNIMKVISGRGITHKGFRWRYSENKTA